MTKDMTQGSPLRLILAFAVPLMLGSLFQQFYNLADTIIVGRFVGVDALAAVGSVGGLNYLVLGFVNGIACGFSIPISWTFGAKDYREMRRYTANTVWLSLFFAVVLTVVTVALTRAVLVWTNTPDNIIDIADIYIRTIFCGIPFTLLYNSHQRPHARAGRQQAASLFPAGGQCAEHRPRSALHPHLPDGGVRRGLRHCVQSGGSGHRQPHLHRPPLPGAEVERGRGPSERQPLPQALQHGHPHGPAMQHHRHRQRRAAGRGERSGQQHRGRADRRQQGRSVPRGAAGEHRHRHDHLHQPEHGRSRLKRVDRGVNTALGIGCVYSVASFLILRVLDVPLISLFLESSEVEIMANARSFIFWNSVFYIPLAVLIIYRYTIQGLGYSGLAMFAGVAEMVARAWWASGSCRSGATLRPASQARWHGSLPASSSSRPTLQCASG